MAVELYIRFANIYFIYIYEILLIRNDLESIEVIQFGVKFSILVLTS